MLFEQPSVGIKIKFQTEQEVETVRVSYEEHVGRMLSLGNDGSVSQHEKEVIKGWDGRTAAYRGGNHKMLAEKLRNFCETTEERVDELLNERDNPDRIIDAGRRYELGAHAVELLGSIELQASMDTALESLI